MPFQQGQSGNPNTQFKPGQSGNPRGYPKGKKNLSTHIQNILTDANFWEKIDTEGKFKGFEGVPLEAIVIRAATDAISGDAKARDWLAKFGYGTRVKVETSQPIPILGGASLANGGIMPASTDSTASDSSDNETLSKGEQMNVVQTYSAWEKKTLAEKKPVGDGQCVSLVINNPESYLAFVFPGVAWENIIKPVNAAKDLPDAYNSEYLEWIPNDHSNPHQLPQVGDIMVFDKTPTVNPVTHKETTNQFDNQFGHDGIAAGDISVNGFDLLQQNAPTPGAAPNVTHYDWNFRLCLGWFRIKTPTPSVHTAPPATTQAPEKTQTLHIAPNTNPMHLYKPGGPYDPSNPHNYIRVIEPAKSGGMSFEIVAFLGGEGEVYRVKTTWGTGDLWTKGSPVSVS